MSDVDRNALMTDYINRLYVHNRYTVENYLIESSYLLELVKDNAISMKVREQDVESIMLRILDSLLLVMAGNKVLLQYGIDYLSKSAPCDSHTVKRKLYAKLSDSQGCSMDETQIALLYENCLTELGTARANLTDLHKVVSGKYFLYNFRHEIKNSLEITGLRDDDPTVFSLARIAKNQGLSEDVSEIEIFLQTLLEGQTILT